MVSYVIEEKTSISEFYRKKREEVKLTVTDRKGNVTLTNLEDFCKSTKLPPCEVRAYLKRKRIGKPRRLANEYFVKLTEEGDKEHKVFATAYQKKLRKKQTGYVKDEKYLRAAALETGIPEQTIYEVTRFTFSFLESGMKAEENIKVPYFANYRIKPKRREHIERKREAAQQGKYVQNPEHSNVVQQAD